MRLPPELTRADSSKLFPVAVDVVVVTSFAGSVTWVVHEEVPPPKVTPGLATAGDEALVGPSTAHADCVGTEMVVPAFVKFALPMSATPAGVSAAAVPAAVSKPAAASAAPAKTVRLMIMVVSSLLILLPRTIRRSESPVASLGGDHPSGSADQPVRGPGRECRVRHRFRRTAGKGRPRGNHYPEGGNRLAKSATRERSRRVCVFTTSGGGPGWRCRGPARDRRAADPGRAVAAGHRERAGGRRDDAAGRREE
ncbi:hypothetical protein SSMG_00274 [Streptomyces sp. AA4]|nr:hypothetical protein SSMG_00274 [Streptomyces sp. AA4]